MNMFFGNGLDYFIMQSDSNRKRVMKCAAAYPLASLTEILSALNLSRKDFTDVDYHTLERDFGTRL